MNIIRKIYQFCKKFYKLVVPARIDKLIEDNKTGVKYLISGGTAAVVDLGLLYGLTDIIGLWYLISATIAFIASLLTSFLLHKFWTFRERSIQRMKKQFLFFTALAIFNLIISIGLLYVLVEIFGVWYMIAQFFIMGGIAMMNFVINKKVTFKKDNKFNKNILLATGIYPPDIGGPATYVKTLEEELPKHGFNVKIITYGEGRNNANIFYVSRKQNKLLRYFKYFWQVLHLLSWANIVYVQGPVSEGLPVYWACKLRDRKYILKIVGDYAWEQFQQRKTHNAQHVTQNFVTLDEFQNKKFDSKTERKRRVEYKVANRAEKIIVPSLYLAGIVKQWGVNSDKINVVYNAVEFTDVRQMDKPVNEKWLVSVGRLTSWKGMDTLIEIMPELLKYEPNLKLKIIGDGPEFNKLQAVSSESGESVSLLGKLSHEETLSYIKTADLFILNSGYEGLSHVLLEALNLNIPIVASNVGGNPELIDQNSLFEYNNKAEIIAKVLQHFKDKNISNNKDLNKFSRSEIVNKTIEILSS